MSNQNILNWEVEFDKEFNVIKYEQDGEFHEGFKASKVPNSKDIKQFIKDLLASSQKDKEKAVEEERETHKIVMPVPENAKFIKITQGEFGIIKVEALKAKEK